MAVLLGLLKAGLESVDDRAVALQGEDQGHVDADALGQRSRDGFEAFKRCRDLDVDVVLVDLGVEVLGLGDGSCGIPSKAGVNLDGDAAIHTLGGGGDGSEEIAGVSDVRGGDFEDRFFDAGTGRGLRCDGGVVIRAGSDGGVEDRRVGGHTNNVLLVDELLQGARLQAVAGKVIKPDGDAGV